MPPNVVPLHGAGKRESSGTRGPERWSDRVSSFSSPSVDHPDPLQYCHVRFADGKTWVSGRLQLPLVVEPPCCDSQKLRVEFDLRGESAVVLKSQAGVRHLFRARSEGIEAVERIRIDGIKLKTVVGHNRCQRRGERKDGAIGFEDQTAAHRRAKALRPACGVGTIT